MGFASVLFFSCETHEQNLNCLFFPLKHWGLCVYVHARCSRNKDEGVQGGVGVQVLYAPGR